MESVEKRIKAIVQAGGEGKVYFPSDFFECGSEKAVSKALQRLVDEEFLVRMMRGLYCFPTHSRWGMGKLTASAEEVVRAYAARDGFRTCPSAFEAQNALGLSEQVVCNPVYSTDGPSRVIPYSKGHRPIVLYHISPRIFSYKSDIIRLTVIALMEIGKEDLWQFDTDNLQYIFAKVPYEEIREDLKRTPVWIRNIILEYYGNDKRQN
ncbi:MAG: hypothetical protein IJ686_02885 [Bacteroidales bacterium]|nr:hypothetical protein [Bacteroidales bacterium]